MGIQLESYVTGHAYAIMQSLVAGTLLHVLLHQPHNHSQSQIRRCTVKSSHQHLHWKVNPRLECLPFYRRLYCSCVTWVVGVPSPSLARNLELAIVLEGTDDISNPFLTLFFS